MPCSALHVRALFAQGSHQPRTSVLVCELKCPRPWWIPHPRGCKLCQQLCWCPKCHIRRKGRGPGSGRGHWRCVPCPTVNLKFILESKCNFSVQHSLNGSQQFFPGWKLLTIKEVIVFWWKWSGGRGRAVKESSLTILSKFHALSCAT